MWFLIGSFYFLSDTPLFRRLVLGHYDFSWQHAIPLAIAAACFGIAVGLWRYGGGRLRPPFTLRGLFVLVLLAAAVFGIARLVGVDRIGWEVLAYHRARQGDIGGADAALRRAFRSEMLRDFSWQAIALELAEAGNAKGAVEALGHVSNVATREESVYLAAGRFYWPGNQRGYLELLDAVEEAFGPDARGRLEAKFGGRTGIRATALPAARPDGAERGNDR